MDVELDLSGHPLGAGRIAEVYAIDDARVVKLLRPEWPDHLLDLEERNARAAHAAGIRSPAVLGRVTLDGRPGIVFERVSAVSMLDAAIADMGRALELADRLGDLHAAMLGTSTPGLPDVKATLARHIGRSGLDAHLSTIALDRLASLPDGDRTLHVDLHPGNVMIGDEGLSVIDWSNASAGHPAADLARSRVLMTPSSARTVVDVDDDAARLVMEFARRYESRCREPLAVSDAEIEAWWLPVLVARLHEVAGTEYDAIHAEVIELVDGLERR